MKHQQSAQRIEELKNLVLENESVYTASSINEIEFDKTFYKAAQNNAFINIDGNRLHMVLCNVGSYGRFVLSIYTISNKNQPRKNKEVSQLICKMVDCLERVFIFLDKLYIVDANQTDKVTYLVGLKKVSGFKINEEIEL